MNKRISIIDTETASMKGNICEMGIAKFTTSGSKLVLEESYSEIVDPQQKIDFEAMNVHHITETMVKGKPLLEEVLPLCSLAESDYVVAHNISYEEAVLPESYFPEGIKRLCTLKLARMLYPKGTVASHKLGVLFYTFGLDQDERVKSFDGEWHRSLFDVFITGLVLEYMLIQNELTIDEAYTLLYDPTVCKGGKKYNKGTPWKDIILEDYDYVEYTFNNTDLSEEELSYLETLLEEYYYLKEEQLDVVGFGKLKGGSWKESVLSDRGYVQWAVNTLQWRNSDELAYVKGLLSGESV